MAKQNQSAEKKNPSKKKFERGMPLLLLEQPTEKAVLTPVVASALELNWKKGGQAPLYVGGYKPPKSVTERTRERLSRYSQAVYFRREPVDMLLEIAETEGITEGNVSFRARRALFPLLVIGIHQLLNSASPHKACRFLPRKLSAYDIHQKLWQILDCLPPWAFTVQLQPDQGWSDRESFVESVREGARLAQPGSEQIGDAIGWDKASQLRQVAVQAEAERAAEAAQQHARAEARRIEEPSKAPDLPVEAVQEMGVVVGTSLTLGQTVWYGLVAAVIIGFTAQMAGALSVGFGI